MSSLISPVLQSAFERILNDQNIPDNQQPFYLQWLERYFQFCKRTPADPGDQNNLEPFLKDFAKQATHEFQVPQAEKSVKLYYTLSTPTLHSNSTFLQGKNASFSTSMSSDRMDAAWSTALERIAVEIRVRHYSPNTLDLYSKMVDQFRRFSGKIPEDLVSADARAYLEHLAIGRQVAASTQNLAFNALLFLYRNVLKKDYSGFEGMPRAKRPKRLPVVLSKQEVRGLCGRLDQPYRLAAQLLYGCGMRVSEGMAIRLQDLDMDRGMIAVRMGKGAKDRFIPLPNAVREDLDIQVARARQQHARDTEAGWNGVFMPDAYEQKGGNAARELGWYWLFPSPGSLTMVTGSGEKRRYHMHPANMQKAIKAAAREANILKRVSPHALRHSYATHLLQAGHDIKTIQDLLGHADLRTTMIYTHLIKADAKPLKSPLDMP